MIELSEQEGVAILRLTDGKANALSIDSARSLRGGSTRGSDLVTEDKAYVTRDTSDRTSSVMAASNNSRLTVGERHSLSSAAGRRLQCLPDQ